MKKVDKRRWLAAQTAGLLGLAGHFAAPGAAVNPELPVVPINAGRVVPEKVTEGVTLIPPG